MKIVAVSFAILAIGAGYIAVSSDPRAGASSCVSRGGLPDRRCTPGVLDRRVTQQNIKRTICKPGYSRTVRPPTSYTNPLKVEGIRQYGFADRRLSEYEEDHLVSISLGGSPTSPRNLWPEPHAGRWGSLTKDKLEFQLYRRVCAGVYRLAAARRDLARNWVVAYERLFASRAGRPGP
jgi:hypothetical protein